MLTHIFSTALQAAEAGRLPDAVVRMGIRKLLQQRLTELQSGDCETRQERFRQFLAECRRSPIAVVPEIANDQHYEAPVDLFLGMLGPRLKYSCCLWNDDVQTLEQAEEAALAETCRRAGIEDGMQILELGCGWGSLSLWMAERFPRSTITAVSNSRSQRSFIESRADRAGLSNLKVLTADMNSFEAPGEYDRVVSIEMFEHMRNHEALLQRIATWLRPGGRLFVHIFCHREVPYLFETDGEADWMGRHFFTGGMMPSDSLLLHCQSRLRIVDQWRWSGMHYSRTCDAWLNQLDRAREPLLPALAKSGSSDPPELQFHRWRMFLMACSELFRFRRGQEWWVSHYLFEK